MKWKLRSNTKSRQKIPLALLHHILFRHKRFDPKVSWPTDGCLASLQLYTLHTSAMAISLQNKSGLSTADLHNGVSLSSSVPGPAVSTRTGTLSLTRKLAPARGAVWQTDSSLPAAVAFWRKPSDRSAPCSQEGPRPTNPTRIPSMHTPIHTPPLSACSVVNLYHF